MAKTVAKKSVVEYCFTAAIIPNGIPIKTCPMMARTERRSVIGNRTLISLKTDCRVRQDSPKSNLVKTFQGIYPTGKKRFVKTELPVESVHRRLWGAGPQNHPSRSPGVTTIMVKTRMMTLSIVGTTRRSLFRIYLCIKSHLLFRSKSNRPATAESSLQPPLCWCAHNCVRHRRRSDQTMPDIIAAIAPWYVEI